MVQVNALAFQEGGDFGKGGGAIIDAVFRRVVTESRAGDDELRVGDKEEFVLAGLRRSATQSCVEHRIPSEQTKPPEQYTHQIDNLPEPHLNTACLQALLSR